MEYTVQKLAKIAGISPRTLRYYDEIEILCPARINSSGYRIYGQNEVNKLQQILFYRELGVSLDEIKKILSSPHFDGTKELQNHHEKLLQKREQLDVLIANVEKSIQLTEGSITMSDQEKFAGFKQKLVDDNEKKYGKEIREKYGDEAVNRSNQKVKNMTQEQHEEVTRLGEEVMQTLHAAVKAGDPASELAQRAADLHRQWLTFYWGTYAKEAHVGITEMYIADERFAQYYDEKQAGSAAFLKDAVRIYTSKL